MICIFLQSDEVDVHDNHEQVANVVQVIEWITEIFGSLLRNLSALK